MVVDQKFEIVFKILASHCTLKTEFKFEICCVVAGVSLLVSLVIM